GARNGIARARAFENVAYVGMVVFEDAVQVRVARARLGDGDRFVAVLRRGGHLLGPVLPVAVLDAERNRRPERLTPADAGADRRLVLLDQHPASAAVALLPAPEVVIDPGEVDREARGHAIDDRRETRPVRFSRGKIPQHGLILLHSPGRCHWRAENSSGARRLAPESWECKVIGEVRLTRRRSVACGSATGLRPPADCSSRPKSRAA